MRGTFPSFLKEVVKTNDHCVFHVNQEAKLVGEVCPKKWGETGVEFWVRCCLTGSGVGEMVSSRPGGVWIWTPCCHPDTINSVFQLLGWGGSAKIFWMNQKNLECHRKLLSAQGFDIQELLSSKPLPTVTSCFWKCGWAHFCSSAGVNPSDCLVTKNKNWTWVYWSLSCWPRALQENQEWKY